MMVIVRVFTSPESVFSQAKEHSNWRRNTGKIQRVEASVKMSLTSTDQSDQIEVKHESQLEECPNVSIDQ